MEDEIWEKSVAKSWSEWGIEWGFRSLLGIEAIGFSKDYEICDEEEWRTSSVII